MSIKQRQKPKNRPNLDNLQGEKKQNNSTHSRYQKQGDVIFHIGGVNIMSQGGGGGDQSSLLDKQYQKFKKKSQLLSKILKSQKLQDILNDPDISKSQNKSQAPGKRKRVLYASSGSFDSDNPHDLSKVGSRTEQGNRSRSGSSNSNNQIQNPVKLKKVARQRLQISENFSLQIQQGASLMKIQKIQKIPVIVISVFQILTMFDHKLNLFVGILILILTCHNFQWKQNNEIFQQKSLQISSQTQTDPIIESKIIMISQQSQASFDPANIVENESVQQKNYTMQKSEIDGSVSDEIQIIDRTVGSIAIRQQNLIQNQLNLKNSMLKDIMLKNISQGAMLCKITKKLPIRATRRMSHADLQIQEKNGPLMNLHERQIPAKSHSIRFGDQSQNKSSKFNTKQNHKIELEVIDYSSKFHSVFDIHYKLQKIPQEQLSSFVLDDSQQIDSTSNIKLSSNNLLNSNYSFLNSMSFNSSLNFGKSKMKIPNFKRSNSVCNEFISNERKISSQDSKQGLNMLEQSMLELKIYLPYFISNETIIQYQSSLKQGSIPKKLSIMDILETHFLEKRTTSRLFFRVDLSEEVENCNLNINFEENNSSQSKSLNNKTLKSRTFKSNEMEDIIETSSLLEREQKKSIIEEEESKLGQDSLYVERSIKFDKLISPKQSFRSQKKKQRKRNFSQDEKLENEIKSSQKRPKMQRANTQLLNNDSSKKEIMSSCSEFSIRNSSELDSKLNQSICGSSNTSRTSQYYEHEQCDIQQHKSHPGNEDKICYFEFEIRQIKDNVDFIDLKNLTFLNIKDITTLVKNQKKFCDKTYQDAIENNYSHEQMTPLNPIMNYSPVVKNNIISLYAEKINKMRTSTTTNNNNLAVEGIEVFDLAKIIQHQKDAKQNIQNIISIEQSAKSIWFYHTNQIKRMKIKKNQLKIEPTPNSNMICTIWNVIWPFEHYIYKRRVNIYLIQKLQPSSEMIADWSLYELVVYNILQNALKYNKNVDGDVVITMTCKKIRERNQNKDKNKYIFETQIIDSGIGIEQERQKMLFKPFQELKDRIGISQSSNESIGLGLSCSSDICKQVGGDITLKRSEAGITVIAFKFPVTLQQIPEQCHTMSDQNNSPKPINRSYLENDDQINSSSINLPLRISKNVVDTRIKFEYIKLIGNNRALSEDLKEHLLQDNMLPKNRELFQVVRKPSSSFQNNSRSKGSVLPLFKEHYSFPNQKIGFQLLESIEKPDSSSVSRKYSVNSFLSLLNVSKLNYNQIPNNQNLNGDQLILQIKKKPTLRKPKQSANNVVSFKENELADEFMQIKSLDEICFIDHFQNDQNSIPLVNKRPLSQNLQLESLTISENISIDDESYGELKGLSEYSNEEIINRSIQKQNFQIEEFEIEEKEEVKVNNFEQRVMEMIIEIEDEQKDSNSPQLDEEEKVNRLRISHQFGDLVIVDEEEYIQGSSIKSNYYVKQPRLHLEFDFEIEKPQHLKKLRVQPVVEVFLDEDQKEQVGQDSPLEIQPSLQQQLIEMDLTNLDQTKKRFVAKHMLQHQNDQKLICKMMQQNYVPPRPRRKIQNQGTVQNILVDIDKQLIREQGFKKYKKSLRQKGIIYNLSESSSLEFQKGSLSSKSSSSSSSSEDYANHQFQQQPVQIEERKQQHHLALPFQNDQIRRRISSMEAKRMKNKSYLHKSKISISEQLLNKPNKEKVKSWEQSQLRNQSQMIQYPESDEFSQIASINSKLDIGLFHDVNRQILVESQNVSLNNDRFQQLLHQNRDKNCDCEPKILIVEDTEFNMMTICSMVVSKFNIEPFEAQNGQIAINMVKQALQSPCQCENRAYKFIIMDINMPIKDGYQATQEILSIMKAHGLQEDPIKEVDKFCNVIALTSYTGVDVEEKCLKVNMKEVFNKPFQANQMKASINKYFFQGEDNFMHYYQMRMLRDEIGHQMLSSNNQ